MLMNGLNDCTGYMEDCPARSVSFGYLQDYANQQPTNGIYYIFLEAKLQFAWMMSLITTNQTKYESYGQGSLGYCPAYNPSGYTQDHPAYNIRLNNIKGQQQYDVTG